MSVLLRFFKNISLSCSANSIAVLASIASALLLTLPSRSGAVSIVLSNADLNADGLPDQVRLLPVNGAGTLPRLEVTYGGSATKVTINSPGGNSFAFDVKVSDQDGAGPMFPVLVVSEPRYMRSGSMTGRIWVFDPRTGAMVRSIDSPGAPATVRIGLRVRTIRDQDLDGLQDLLVEGAARVHGSWSPRTYLYSGSDGRLLSTIEQGFSLLSSIADAGTNLYSPADVNSDGVIDLQDLTEIAMSIGDQVTPHQGGDLSGDGVVTAEDLQMATDEFMAGNQYLHARGGAVDAASLVSFDRVWSQAYSGAQGTPASDGAGDSSGTLSGGGSFDAPIGSPGFSPGDGDSGQQPQAVTGGEGPLPLFPIPGLFSCGDALSLDCGIGSPPIFDPQSANMGWCLLEMNGCPSGAVQIGDYIPIHTTGAIVDNPNVSCRDEFSLDGLTWVPLDELGEWEGLVPLEHTPAGGFSAVQVGCMWVRKFCELPANDPNSPTRGCCACAQCVICVEGPEPPPCPAKVQIYACQPFDNDPDADIDCDPDNSGICTVFRSSCDPVRLTARGTPSGGYFEWRVDEVIYSEQPWEPNPNSILLLPEDLSSGCVFVKVKYCLLDNQGQPTTCCDEHIVRILNNDDDCDDLTNEAEDQEWSTDKSDPDTDDDGFCDGIEAQSDSDPLDPASHPAIIHGDDDDDGLATAIEYGVRVGVVGRVGLGVGQTLRDGSDPRTFDTDLDGVQDLAEVELGLNPSQYYLPPTPQADDSVWSVPGGLNITRSSDRFTSAYQAADRDQDLLYDEYERQHGLDPDNPDIDGDGIRDGIEVRSGTDPRINHRFESADTDGDGLCDYEETTFYGTNPDLVDSDKDGLPDGFEILAGLNPHSAYTYQVQVPLGATGASAQFSSQRVRDIDADLDEDGLSNFYELLYKSDPLNPDTDGDGVNDGAEVDQGTLPGNPADGNDAVPAEELCVLRITVGSHTSADDCWGGTSPSDDAGSLIQYDPIHGPASGEHDKRDQHWTVNIGGAGAVGLNGGVPFALSTQPDGSWGQFDLVVRKGQCIPMHLAYGGPANGSQNDPHFSLHVIPVDHRGGQPCLTCCCLLFDHGDPDVNGTRTGAMPFFGSACDVIISEVEGRTGYVCLPLADIDIDSDNNDGLAAPKGNAAEETLEEDTSSPGKLVFIRRTDADNDGVIDWADGIDADLPVGDSSPGAQTFVPLILRVGGISNANGVKVRLSYSLSDPNEVTASGPFGVTPVTWYTMNAPAVGTLRIWTVAGNQQRDPRSFRTQINGDGGNLILPETDYPLRALIPENETSITLYVEAVKPSLTPGASPISVQVTGSAADCLLNDSVRTTAVDLVAHDLRHWEPAINPDTGLPFLTKSLTNSQALAQPSIDGVITDGCSVVLLECSPSLGSGVSLTLRVRHADGRVFEDRPAIVGALSLPDSLMAATLPSLPMPRVPIGRSSECTAAQGNFFYTPPSNYLAADENLGSSYALSNNESTLVLFEAITNGKSCGSFPFILRRPPIILVHGLFGDISKGYWGSSYNESPLAGPSPWTGFGTRVYQADYATTSKAGYSESFTVVPSTIATALAEYRSGCFPCTSPGHSADHEFYGKRFAATRADIVAHSMGGLLTRLYVSGATGTATRVASDPSWPAMNFTRTASQYYLRPDNFACGDIRRFVTIGTPFNGAVDADAWRTSQEGGAMQSSVLGWKPLATATDWIEGEEQRQKMVDDEGNPTRHTAALDLQRGSIAQQILDGAVPPLEGGSWTPASYPTNDRAVWWFPLVFRVALEGSDEAHPEASEFMSNTRRAIRWVSLPQADLDQVNAGNSDFVVTMNSQRNSNGNNDRNQNRGFVFHNHVHSRSRTSLGRVKNEMDSPEVPPFIEKKLRRDETEFYSDGLNE